jgi:hypothetical protein
MANQFLSLVLAGMVIGSLLTIPSIAPAQGTGQGGTADIAGYWDREREAGESVDPDFRRFGTEQPPLQPWAMEIFRANRGNVGMRRPQLNGIDQLDPVNNCFPAGFPRVMLLRTFQIVPLADQVLMIFEYGHSVRRIYTDGRGHPDGYPPGWMGHSIGRWDGDALVVDTVALNDRTWMDRIGTPHSDALHVVERIRRAAQDRLEVEFTFEDPKAFTRAWGGTKDYIQRPNLEMLEHVVCDHLFVLDKTPGVQPRFDYESMDPGMTPEEWEIINSQE